MGPFKCSKDFEAARIDKLAAGKWLVELSFGVCKEDDESDSDDENDKEDDDDDDDEKDDDDDDEKDEKHKGTNGSEDEDWIPFQLKFGATDLISNGGRYICDSNYYSQRFVVSSTGEESLCFVGSYWHSKPVFSNIIITTTKLS